MIGEYSPAAWPPNMPPDPAGLPNNPPVLPVLGAPNPVVAGLAPNPVEVDPNRPPVLPPAALLADPNAGVLLVLVLPKVPNPCLAGC